MLYTSGFNYVVVTGFTKLKIAKFCFISLLIPISFLYNLSKLPIQYENIKGSIKFIQENISENENIYIYSFAIPGYEYYNSIGFANTKNWHSVYSSRDINELNDLRGKTWLLFSHIADEDEEFMINHIDSLGHTKIKEFKTFGSSAYLYDFGE
ncbi:hypothetical protein FACS189426_09860 [Bacteroidia bacterium]|nr:hypothetical protein FACS189426_09860 [Bacteroidia bacterium]